MKKRLFSSLMLTLSLLTFFSSINAQTIRTVGNTGANYITLKTAFDSINQGKITGNIILKIIASTSETASAVLNASGTGSANYSSVKIFPSIDGLSISGNLNSNLIDLNGADNITIDGSLNMSGGNAALTITNSSATSAAGTIRFINGASGNIIKNCIVKGSETSATGGIFLISTSTGVSGNSNNLIDSCNITNAGSRPINAVYAAGSVGFVNTLNTLSNCNIYNFLSNTATSYGVNIGANNNSWSLNGNSFYETTTMAPTGTFLYYLINIVNASGGNFAVSNNYLGGNAAQATGTWQASAASSFRLFPITMNVAASPTSSVQGNFIRGFSISTTNAIASAPGIFTGIVVNGGIVNIGTSNGNIIGDSGNGSISITSTTSGGYVAGIYASSTSGMSIQNNTIASFNLNGTATIGYSYYGINTVGVAGSYSISNNNIGGAVANSISLGVNGTTTAWTHFYGIYNTATGNISISSNKVRNISSYGTGASVFYGLTNAAACSALQISNDSLYNITDFGTGIFNGFANSGALTGDATFLNNYASNINFSAVTASGAVNIINNTAGTNTISLLIRENFISGLNFNGTNPGTGAINLINNSAAVLNSTIDSNQFNNITLNSTGAIYLINNNYTAPANGTKVINTNLVITAFTRTGGGAGATYGYNDRGASPSSVSHTISGNNFSNITIPGANTGGFTGIYSTDASASWPSLNVTYNIINNVSCGTGAVYGLYLNGFGGSLVSPNVVSYNTISNLSSASTTVSCIYTGANAQYLNIYNNAIDSISTSGVANVYGINTNAGSGMRIGSNNINTFSVIGASTLRGIYSTSTGQVTIENNNIQGFFTYGVAATAFSFYGINSAGTLGNFTITGNTIGGSGSNAITMGSNGISTAATSVYGIYNTATGSINVINNTIQNCYSYGTGASIFYGMYNNGIASDLTLNGNSILNNTLNGTGAFYGIYNFSAVINTITIKGNNLSGFNHGSLTTTGNVFFIYNQAAGASSTLTIRNNILGSINYLNPTGGSGTFSCIYSSAAPLNSYIDSNSFTSMTVNTSGLIYLIYNNYVLAANGFKSIQNNITTGLIQRNVGGTNAFYAYYDAGASPSSTNHLIANNNFSNISISLTNTGGFNGIYSSNASNNPTLNVYGNVISNIICGSGAVNLIYLNGFSGTIDSPNRVYNNTLSNLSCASTAVNALYTGSKALYVDLYNNSFTNIASSGTGTYYGISQNGGNSNIYNNSFDSLNVSSATPVRVLSINSVGTVNVYSNALNSFFTNGAAGLAYTYYGISTAGTGGSMSVYNNTIGNNNASAISVGVNGVSTGATAFYGIYNTSTGNFSANGNTIKNCASYGSGASVINGISSTAAATSTNISNNSLSGLILGGTGIFNGISNSGAVVSTCDISNNSIVNCSLTASTASGAVNLINNTTSGVSSTLNIHANTLGSVTFSGLNAGSGTFSAISNSGTPLNSKVDSNALVNINLNTTGIIYLINNNYLAPANGSKVVQYNYVSGSCGRTAGGANGFFGYNDRGTSPTTVSHIISNNNFSNITISASNTGGFTGIYSTDFSASNPGLTVFNNIVSNISCGSGAVNGLYLNGFGGTSLNPNQVYSNTISNISSASTAVSGIYLGAQVLYLNTYSNTISNISTSGAGLVYGLYSAGGTGSSIYGNILSAISSSGASTTVYGIFLAAGTTSNIYKNNVFNLSSSGATGSAFGYYVSGGATNNFYNNFVSDLRASTSTGANAVVGVYLNAGTTNNLFYNTIYLSATSSSSTFGSSGIYAVTSTNLTLQNNIVINKSTPGSSSGYTAAMRFSSTILTGYNANSNNNNFFSGTPASRNVIFYNGTTAYQTLANFKTLVGTRDLVSFTENTPFINTVSTPYDLHISGLIPTLCESGGIRVTSPIAITDDFDGNVRYGESGYSGNGTAPDVGACEFNSCNSVAITSQPTSPLAGCTGTGILTLSVSVSGSPTYSYQWQINNSGWVNITNGGLYTNAFTSNSSSNTNILTITNPDISLNGKLFRCVIQNCANYNTVNTNGTSALTINALPVVSITGDSVICTSTTTTLSPSTNGTWTSSNNSVAIVDSLSGIVSGISNGSVAFTFTSSLTGCSNSTHSLTINPRPSIPTGSTSQTPCLGSLVNDLSASGTNVEWYNISIGGTPLSGSTSLGNQHYYAASTLNGCQSLSRLDVSVTLASGLWTGLGGDNNWSNALNWCGGVPTQTTNVTISNASVNVTDAQSSPSVCNNLLLKTASTLTINEGKGLTVYGNIADSSGSASLVVKSSISGQGSLITYGNLLGPGTHKVDQYLVQDIGIRYNYISSPMVTTQTNIFSGYYMYKFLENTNAWSNMAANANMDVTKGYSVYKPNTLSNIISYSGQMNTGAYGTADNMTRTDSLKGWNLCGNPYPSSIDWDATSGWTRTNLYNSIYTWNQALKTYSSYVDGIGTNGATSQINPMQGYMVRVSDGYNLGTLKFNDSIRIHTLPQGKKPQGDFIKLQFSANEFSDEAVVRFVKGSTTGFDSSMDAFKFLSEDAPGQIYTIAAKNQLSINSLPEITEGLVIPLHLAVNESGRYSMNADNISSLPQGTFVYLRDYRNNHWQLLSSDSHYAFGAEKGDDPARFALYFSRKSMNIDQASLASPSLYVYSSDMQVYLNSVLPISGTVRIYDLTGRKVIDQTYENFTQISIPMTNQVQGCYLVNFTSNSQTYCEKVIIR